ARAARRRERQPVGSTWLGREGCGSIESSSASDTRMKFSRRQGLVIVGALASLMACSSLLAADGIVEGSGRMTSVTRPAAGVARLAVAGPFSVEVRQG